jgi:NADPH2:quinone reductase
MKALILEEFKKPPTVKQVQIPTLSANEVLVRVESTAINPSDLAFLNGNYHSSRKCPCVPGFEGSGVIIKSGGGTYADSLVNKRVSFSA